MLGTVEKKLLAMQERKRSLANAALGQGEGASETLGGFDSEDGIADDETSGSAVGKPSQKLTVQELTDFFR